MPILPRVGQTGQSVSALAREHMNTAIQARGMMRPDTKTEHVAPEKTFGGGLMKPAGGAAGGASVGAAIGGSAGGPYGAIIGGVVGLLGYALS